MLAIDTNVIVRYLADDHPGQSARAKALIDEETVFVSATVLLETEWVLRSVYDYPATRLAKALRAFAGLPPVVIEDSRSVALALDWMESGLDLADALHLARAKGCAAFITFDQRFARRANLLDVIEVREP